MFSLWFLLQSWSQVSEKVGQRRKTHGQHAADIFKQHLGTLALLLNNIFIITIMHWTCPPAPVPTNHMKKHSAHQLADFGMCLLNSEAEEGQGVCPAAQWGHFHLNRGPWVPSGVTLATVITIVPAVSVCVKERGSYVPFWGESDLKTDKIFEFSVGCPKRANVSSVSESG